MNVNFKAIEKAWFKPKKTVLEELEEYLRNEYEELKQYGADYFASHGIEHHIVGRYETIEDILDKIQELKKDCDK